jgi:hypothetical protein
VLFEYGTHDFTNGFKQEAERVKKFCVDMVGKPKASPSPGAKKKITADEIYVTKSIETRRST